jgi:hypothetical protein
VKNTRTIPRAYPIVVFRQENPARPLRQAHAAKETQSLLVLKADPVDQLETEAAAVTKCGRGSWCSDSTEQIQHGLHELCNMEALVCGMSNSGVTYLGRANVIPAREPGPAEKQCPPCYHENKQFKYLGSFASLSFSLTSDPHIHHLPI